MCHCKSVRGRRSTSKGSCLLTQEGRRSRGPGVTPETPKVCVLCLLFSSYQFPFFRSDFTLNMNEGGPGLFCFTPRRPAFLSDHFLSPSAGQTWVPFGDLGVLEQILKITELIKTFISQMRKPKAAMPPKCPSVLVPQQQPAPIVL